MTVSCDVFSPVLVMGYGSENVAVVSGGVAWEMVSVIHQMLGFERFAYMVFSALPVLQTHSSRAKRYVSAYEVEIETYSAIYRPSFVLVGILMVMKKRRIESPNVLFARLF